MSKNKGFSVVELIVVVGIMGMLMLVVLPITAEWMVKHRTNLSAQEVSMLLQRARALAVSGSQKTRVSFNLTASPNEAFIEVNRGVNVWIPLGVSGTTLDATDRRARVVLPEGTSFSGTGKDKFYFERDGIVVEDGNINPGEPIDGTATIVLVNYKGYQSKVRVKPSGKIEYVRGV